MSEKVGAKGKGKVAGVCTLDRHLACGLEAPEGASQAHSTRGRPAPGNEAVLGNGGGVGGLLWVPQPSREGGTAEEGVTPNQYPETPAVRNKHRQARGVQTDTFAHSEIVSSSQANYFPLY